MNDKSSFPSRFLLAVCLCVVLCRQGALAAALIPSFFRLYLSLCLVCVCVCEWGKVDGAWGGDPSIQRTINKVVSFPSLSLFLPRSFNLCLCLSVLSILVSQSSCLVPSVSLSISLFLSLYLSLSLSLSVSLSRSLNLVLSVSLCLFLIVD